MPTGLPPSLFDILINFRHKLDDAIIYLQIPSSSELVIATKDAYTDSLHALQSNTHLILLIFRPVVILLSVLLNYASAVAQVILRHTLYHLWVVIKQFSIQLAFCAKQAYLFQRSLSNFWILVELGFIAFCVAVYLLRRFIKKRRYVERVVAWYNGKKKKAIAKYNRAVQKVSETSMTLALLIPHILFLTAAIGVKYTFPTIVRYLASRTPLAEVISLGVPSVKTLFYLLGKIKPVRKSDPDIVTEDKQSEEKVVPKWRKSKVDIEKKDVTDDKKPPQRKSTGRGSVADRWLNAVDKPGTISSVTSKPTGDKPAAFRKFSQTPKDQDPPFTITKKADQDDLATALLRYWVVCFLIGALIEGINLLPIVSTMVTSEWRYLPSTAFYAELKLMFYIWLTLPAPSTDAQTARNNKMLTLSPVQIIYSEVTPMAQRIANFSDYIPENTKESSLSYITRFIPTLDLLVFARVISKETKDKISIAVADCYNLFPALLTIFMPSVFTSFGCLYASSLVPACNSSTIINNLPKSLRGSEARQKLLEQRTRYLKYYLIAIAYHYVVEAIPWFPFKLRATLIGWVMLNLPGMVGLVTRLVESELIGLGLWEGDREVAMENTITMRMLRRMQSSLPTASASQIEGDNESSNMSNEGNQVDPAKSETSTESVPVGESTAEMPTEPITKSGKTPEKKNDTKAKTTKTIQPSKVKKASQPTIESMDDKTLSKEEIGKSTVNNANRDDEKTRTTKTTQPPKLKKASYPTIKSVDDKTSSKEEGEKSTDNNGSGDDVITALQ